jgi:hypothetical protein
LGALFFGGDRVFCGFGDAEFYDRLGFDLDRLTGLRIASDARLAMGFYQSSDARNHKNPVLFGFFDRGVGQILKKCGRSTVICPNLFRQVTDQLRLGHASCHESSSFADKFSSRLRSYLNTRRLWKNSKITAFYAGFSR